MAISRAQMRTQLKGGTMKKTKKKSGGGKLLAAISPAYALSKSLKSGKAEGILGMGLLGAMHNKSLKDNTPVDADNPKSNMAARIPMAMTRTASKMKYGGRVRGDGICRQGKTKGSMR